MLSVICSSYALKDRSSAYRAASFLSPSLRVQYELAVSALLAGNPAEAAKRAKLASLPKLVTVKIERDDDDSHLAAARSAMQKWNDSLGYGLFQEVDGDANVVITYAKQVRSGRSLVAGLNNWTRTIDSNDELSLQSSISIATRSPRGSALSQAQVEKTTLHELGHLLGLDDESSSDALMGPLSLDHEPTINTPALIGLTELSRQAEEISAAAAISKPKKTPKIFRFKG